MPVTRLTIYHFLTTPLLAFILALGSNTTLAYVVEFEDVAATIQNFDVSGGRLVFRKPGTNGIEESLTNPTPNPRTDTMLDGPNSPVFSKDGNPGRVELFAPLIANNGDFRSSTGAARRVLAGSASQDFSVTGDYRVKPQGDEPDSGDVRVLYTGLIKGRTFARATATGSASASVQTTIAVTPFKTITGSSSASSTGGIDGPRTITVELSPTPSVSGQVTLSPKNSQNKARTSITQSGKVPIDTPQSFTMSGALEAMLSSLTPLPDKTWAYASIDKMYFNY